MSFIRPELAIRLRLWREPIIWGLTLAAGLALMWRGWHGGALLALVGGFLLAGAGLGLLVTTLRRMRLQGVMPDEGVVLVREARIAYLGPRGGGFIDLDGLARVEIVTDGQRPAWWLTAEDGAALRVPLGARGAEGLYDALSAFAALDDEALQTALATRRAGRFPVWVRAETARLERLP